MSAVLDSAQAILDRIYEADKVKPACTPFATLGADIVSKIPDLNGAIFVISDLGLLTSVVIELKNRGLPRDQLTFLAHTPEQAVLSSQMLAVETLEVSYNVPMKELEKQLKGRKFDVIIQNPPYQGAGDDSAQKPWKSFITLGERLLNDGGIMSVICPSSWGKPLGAKPTSTNKDLTKAIFGNTILHSNFTTSEFFPTVGVDISWFSIQKNGIPNHPEGYCVRDKAAGEVLQKVITSGLKPPTFLTDANTAYKQGTKKVKERTEVFKYPIRDKKIIWTDVYDPVMEKPKIIFPRNFGYHVFEDAKGEFALPQSGYGLIVENTATALTWFRSKLMRFIMTRCSWTPQLDFAMLNIVPIPDLNRSWTDQELYEEFKLTESEIKMVEAAIK